MSFQGFSACHTTNVDYASIQIQINQIGLSYHGLKDTISYQLVFKELAPFVISFYEEVLRDLENLLDMG